MRGKSFPLLLLLTMSVSSSLTATYEEGVLRVEEPFSGTFYLRQGDVLKVGNCTVLFKDYFLLSCESTTYLNVCIRGVALFHSDLELVRSGELTCFEGEGTHIYTEFKRRGSPFPFLLLLLPLLFLLAYGLKKRSRERRYELLPERERRILKLLEKGPRSQKEICEELGAPKSSISRILRGMEARGLVSIERKGLRNIVRVK